MSVRQSYPSLSGYIPYTGATTNVDLGLHNLTVDTNTLFVDSVNHRVGIGTTSPAGRLDVLGDISLFRDSATGDLFRINPLGANLGVNIESLNSDQSAYKQMSLYGSQFHFLFGGSEKVSFDTNGNVGIGTISPNQALEVNGNVIIGASPSYGPSSGLSISRTISNANFVFGYTIEGTYTSTGQAAYAMWMNPILHPADTKSATLLYAGGTIDTTVAQSVTSYGFYIADIAKTGAGTIANQYGIYVHSQTGGTNNYAAYLDGKVGIGIAPTALLCIKAGTATAGTAPLKLTSGTLLTGAEAGAIEFLTDAYYGTITTGPTRKTFAFLESPTFTGTVNMTDLTVTNLTSSGSSVITTDVTAGHTLKLQGYTGAAYSDLLTITNAATPTISIAGPTLTGHPVIEGVTSTGATGTGKLVFDTSPTIVTPTITTSINCPLIKPPADGTSAIKLTKADGTTSVFVVDTTNIRVGVNVAAPAAALDLVINGTNAMRCEATGEQLILVQHVAGNPTYQAWYNTTPARRGYFGFPSGSSSNFSLLNEENGTMVIGTNNATAITISTAQAIRFNAYGAGTLATDASGNITASDVRLKDIQGDFTVGLPEVLQLNPKLFKWNDKSGWDTTNIYAGFIAQEVAQYIPEAVGKNKDGIYNLTDRVLIAALVNAVKELKAEIDELRNQLGLEPKDYPVSAITDETRILVSPAKSEPMQPSGDVTK